MTSYEHIRELDDPAKPHRRVWRCASGVFVKTHAILRKHALGRFDWCITGSLCDANGKACARGGGVAIGEAPHLLVIYPDASMAPEARESYIARQYEAALLVMVRRIEAAVLNEAAAERAAGTPRES